MKMIEDCESLSKVEKAILDCLNAVPFIKIVEIKRSPSLEKINPDLLVNVDLSGKIKTLLVEAKNNGQPKLARDAINQLFRLQQFFPDSYGIFAAPYISSQAMEMCRSEGIGTLDFAGNCFLCFENVFINQQGAPNRFAVKRDLRSLYSPKATRALRVLLANPKKGWKIQELAKEAKISLGQAANIKKLLADREWITSDQNGLLLLQPETLLKEWAQNYSMKKSESRSFYSIANPKEIEIAIARVCKEVGILYSLTGFSAADRLAPFVRYQKVTAYVEGIPSELAGKLNIKPVTSGPNLILYTPYDSGIFYGSQIKNDVQIVSPIQAYLDLVNNPSHGEEAAEALLEQVIRPSW